MRQIQTARPHVPVPGQDAAFGDSGMPVGIEASGTAPMAGPALLLVRMAGWVGIRTGDALMPFLPDDCPRFHSAPVGNADDVASMTTAGATAAEPHSAAP